MGILAFIVIGLLAGLIARALMPGNQSMGLVATTLLGMVGSLVGGLVGSLFSRNGRIFDLHPTGLILSVIGSIIVLLLVGYSGHERGIAVSEAAATLGACVVERHFTKDRTLAGPDHAASLEATGLEKLVRDIRHGR